MSEAPRRNRLMEIMKQEPSNDYGDNALMRLATGSARAYEPTMRDSIAAWLMGDQRASPAKARFIEGLMGSRGMGTKGIGLADLTPLGIPMGVQDASRGDEPVRDSLLAIFAGPAARTADRTALAAAQKLKAAGAPREQIWKDTGWFEGVDGKWRFEIDDSKATLPWGDSLSNNSLAMSLSHPKIYRSYKDLENAKLKWLNQSGGEYIAPFATIPEHIKAERGNVSTLLHEVQHGVQRREGFALGGNNQKETAVATYNDIVRRIQASIDDAGGDARNATPEVRAEIDRLRKSLRTLDVGDPSSVYKRLAGEVEARAVQKRIALTPDQRRDRAPWLDYDVPEDQQIVRFK